MKHRAALLAVTLASTGCPKAPPSPPPPPPPSTDVPAVRDVPAADAGDPNAPMSRLTPFRTRNALTAWLRARLKHWPPTFFYCAAGTAMKRAHSSRRMSPSDSPSSASPIGARRL